VGCRFCASGIGGLEANLTTGQIVEQVWQLECLRLEQASLEEDKNRSYDTAQSSSIRAQTSCPRRPITHVVFMGMGEPLANLEKVVAAVRTLTAHWGPNISARRITISTVGLPAQIRRLAQLGLPLTLAISLHAPNDELRRRLIPWADYVQIDQIIDAAKHYFARTGREVTIEYLLLRQVNDRPEHARQLAEVARRLRSNVNLIRYNEVKGLPFARPATNDVWQFQQVLHNAGINTHIRASRGRDIAAACGQLRVHGESPMILNHGPQIPGRGEK
jgi:23S rRNA (adenine2503-C2)-methyltransferase